MRNFIIGLSILFFGLSVTITFNAIGILLKGTQHQNNQKESKSEDLSPEADDILRQFAEEQAANKILTDDILRQFAKEQAANRNLIEDLQATIAGFEDKLPEISKETGISIETEPPEKNMETGTSIETESPEKKEKVLAVLGAGAFRSGDFLFNENMMNYVYEIVREILASPDDHIIIEGHTDNIPVNAYGGGGYIDNIELSFLRAKAVAQILLENDISNRRISVIGHGDTRPIVPNDTDENRARNRRVEVKLIPENEEF